MVEGCNVLGVRVSYGVGVEGIVSVYGGGRRADKAGHLRVCRSRLKMVKNG